MNMFGLSYRASEVKKSGRRPQFERLLSDYFFADLFGNLHRLHSWI